MSDPINHHPHSRFTLHEKAYLYPFRDLIWNKSDGPFIDLKVDFPDPTNNYADGTAYLRVEDVVEMAHVLGMATLDEVTALKNENAELRARLNELPTKVESYKNELSRVTSEFLASLDSTVTLVVPDVPKSEDPEPTYLTEQSAVKQPVWPSDEGTKPRPKRNNSSSGRANDTAKQSGDESSVGKGPNELSGSVDKPAGESLTSLLGL